MNSASRDRLVELDDVPQSDVGAPNPGVVSDEHFLSLVYIVSEPDPDWDGSDVNIVSSDSLGMSIAIIGFRRVYAHTFGPPNDEAIEAHPLASKGLQAYSAYRVRHSSWKRDLEARNAVHRHHRPGFLDPYQHYVFTFHDSTFECIARAYGCRTHRGTLREALVMAATDLGRED